MYQLLLEIEDLNKKALALPDEERYVYIMRVIMWICEHIAMVACTLLKACAMYIVYVCIP